MPEKPYEPELDSLDIIELTMDLEDKIKRNEVTLVKLSTLVPGDRFVIFDNIDALKEKIPVLYKLMISTDNNMSAQSIEDGSHHTFSPHILVYKI